MKIVRLLKKHYSIKTFSQFNNKKTKLQYISDLHLDYPNNNNIPIIPDIKADILAILGDIGNPFHPNYKKFLESISDSYEKILILSGNHEYWDREHDMEQIDDKIKSITIKFGNIQYLNNNKINIGKTTIIGTTLWSNIEEKSWNERPSDISIKNITWKKYNDKHTESVRYLKDNIVKDSVILTHHLPSFQLIIDKYKTTRYIPYNSRYATDLEYLMSKNIKFWLCGHSHCQIEKIIGNTFCGINTLGYTYELNNNNVLSDAKYIEF